MHTTIIFWILAAAFLVLGFVLIGLGLGFNSYFKKRKSACTVKTDAIVVEINREVNLSAGGDSYRSWFPVFSYRANGEDITERSKLGHGKKIFEKGQKVTLFYAPDNVHEFYVPEENASALPKVFIVVGGTFAILGLVCLCISLALLNLR